MAANSFFVYFHSGHAFRCTLLSQRHPAIARSHPVLGVHPGGPYSGILRMFIEMAHGLFHHVLFHWELYIFMCWYPCYRQCLGNDRGQNAFWSSERVVIFINDIYCCLIKYRGKTKSTFQLPNFCWDCTCCWTNFESRTNNIHLHDWQL